MDIIPLVDNLEILGIFKDEDKEEEDSVTDALSTMLWLLGEELEEASWLLKLYNEVCKVYKVCYIPYIPYVPYI